MGQPATRTGLYIYQSLHALHGYAERWWVRLLCPGLKRLVDQHHHNLDGLRQELGRDLPTWEQCKEFGIPDVRTRGGGQK